ncbi:MAG: type II toxin-antitoxin system Phd/YefM family antitoxin [Solirubrobacteraceae bacterium]
MSSPLAAPLGRPKRGFELPVADKRSTKVALDQRRTRATLHRMTKEVTQRQLRNDSGEIMRALDRGESFVVTRNGVAVGELRPVQRHRFVDREAVREVFARAARLDPGELRADLDRWIDQDPTPRG